MGGCTSAPDTGPQAAANIHAANVAAVLGTNQLAFNNAIYQENKGFVQDLAKQEALTQQESRAQAKDYKQHWDRFAEVEKGLISDVDKFNGGAYANQRAASALADVENQQRMAHEINSRRLASMGLDPTSGRAASANRSLELGNAAARANAMNVARRDADNMAWARKLDVSGLGRNMTGASTGAYGAASNAAGMGSNIMNNNAQLGMQGLSAGTNTLMQGAQNFASNQNSLYQNEMSGYNAKMGMLGSIAGGAAGAGTAYLLSDRRLKKNIRRIGIHEQSGFVLYMFNYIDMAGTFIGVMADEVKKVIPQAVTTGADGFMRVNYDMIGVPFTIVAE